MSVSRLSREDRCQLAKWTRKDNTNLKLLYSASRDGCSEASFHQKCDKQGATVSIAYTNDGYVYGGYTSAEFDVSGAWKPANESFLFKLKKEGFTDFMIYPAATGYIYCHSNNGPTFGNASGVELTLFNGSKATKDGDVFTLNADVKVGAFKAFDPRNQTAADMAGNSKQFLDVEVYQVCDLRQLDPEQPWRRIGVEWAPQDLAKLKSEVSRYKPSKSLEISKTNILLIGQVGVGKSSFCNTIHSVFTGHVTTRANAGSCESSMTTKLRKYDFRNKERGKGLKFRICDTMGLEDSNDLTSINFQQLLDGNVEDRYQFNPTVPISQGDMGYRMDPKLKDKVHVVCFVMDGSMVHLLSGVLLEKLKLARMQANQRGIHMMILMTKVDLLDPLVSDDIRNVYLSMEVRDTVEILSSKTGIPLSNIIPIKSYERETELSDMIDILALAALRQMLRLADDFFQEQVDLRGLGQDSDSDAEDDEENVKHNVKTNKGRPNSKTTTESN